MNAGLGDPSIRASPNATVVAGNRATIVPIAWSALYFGIKHYGTVEEQRGKLVASEATAREG